jgi:hypothetical protein
MSSMRSRRRARLEGGALRTQGNKSKTGHSIEWSALFVRSRALHESAVAPNRRAHGDDRLAFACKNGATGPPSGASGPCATKHAEAGVQLDAITLRRS